jgi:hypothetical protein
MKIVFLMFCQAVIPLGVAQALTDYEFNIAHAVIAVLMWNAIILLYSTLKVILDAIFPN